MSLVRFGINKPVPVNLLMVATLIAGTMAGTTLRRQFFPEAPPDTASVSMPYPGASAEEIEQTLGIKVEDALANLDEVDELITTISEGGGGVVIKFREGIDPDAAVEEVERAVEALRDLPAESERLQTQLFEIRLPVIRLVVYGDLDEAAMKSAIRAVQDDLRALPGMGEVIVEGVRDYEIRVDVNREAALRQGLSLPQISDAIRAWMADVPGGTVRSQQGNVKVRTVGVAERAAAIRGIVLQADPRRGVVRVSDVAEVTESFVDQDLYFRFNGLPAKGMTIFKVGDQDIVKIAEMVRAYVAGRQGKPADVSVLESWMGSDRLEAWKLGADTSRAWPAGAKIQTNADLARYVEGRLDLLTRNALYGAMLVFATLLVFLNWRVALWVGVGLVLAIMGTLVMMSLIGITLNLLTMFGLIVVLGLLVDDAIVVSENIQSQHERGLPAREAGEKGAHEVLWPVVATVLTSVVAFLPLTFIKGQIGTLMGALPTVVACALLMSLIESLLILPSHMAHSLERGEQRRPNRLSEWVKKFEAWRDRVLMKPLIEGHARLLAFALRHRYETWAAATAVLILSLGMLAGGRLAYRFLPESDAETLVVDVSLPIGSPVATTDALVREVEKAASQQSETKSVATVIGLSSNIETGAVDALAPHRAQMFIELHEAESRQRSSDEVTDAIRDAMRGKIDEAERVSFTQISGGPAGADITIRLGGDDPDALRAAAEDVKQALATFAGVNEIADDDNLGQPELRVRLRPGAGALGFTTTEVARQVRGALYGIEAHVYADRREDIDVRVRHDEKTRRSIYDVRYAWLVSPQGRRVPLSEIADIERVSTYSTIRRVDRQRVIDVTASTVSGISPETIVADLDLAALQAKHPGVKIKTAGRQKQQRDAFGSLPYGFLAAMVMIYVILAWLFDSYLQPLVVLLVVPFAFVGVVWGHLLFGFQLNFLSLIGYVALSGIVVNDSLILVKFYNDRRRSGIDVETALLEAGRARFRAIMLTTITTVLGLTPLLLEQSFQARFLIPMGISIAMGLLAATVLILVVLPCMIRIGHDLRGVGHFLWSGRRRPVESPATQS